MRKIFSFFMLVFIVFSVAGCSKNNRKPNEKTTLMIYMIGSDLEAKGGSATADLEEVAASGIDLSRNNVLVYAGGSKKWHNELNMSEEKHTVMHLTEIGFQIDKTKSNSSMGESKAFSDFLNYAFNSYPADKYALILWNHGNGPVIGYGKDMLHDNDSLTLKEMQTAFENSPFSSENKLEWVGFDACMMASAELACVFDDYADYLVASQEIEPYFGWDYSFLSEFNKTDCKTMLKNIAVSYLQTCEEYYEQKGYSDRDTTLSVIDLSEVKNMESAIDALFAKASTEVDEKYNNFTTRRVDTRALGRASTGSEYDLIDLKDMAEKLADIYPEETKNLIDAIEKTVIANETNTEDLCGLSLYYPFYNKSYYETDWAEIYEDLGLFSEYRDYLQNYSEIWLRNDMFDAFAKSVTPKKIGKNTYNLELTDEQAETYADAKYYVLQKEGHGLYTPLFVSTNVEKKGNTLITEFDGNIIYGKDKFNNYFIPVSQEHDSVGDLTRYSIYVNASNAWVNGLKRIEDHELIVNGLNYQIAVNTEEKEIAVSSLVPWDTETDASGVVSGKFEEVDLSEYSLFTFPSADHKYLTRYDNGVVKPISEWYVSFYNSFTPVPVKDEVSFVFEPLTQGNYCIVFEIEDTQGNRYCSEPIEIENGEYTFEDEIVPEPVKFEWGNTEVLPLGEYSGVDVSLRIFSDYSQKRKYTIECKNNNDFAVDFWATDVFVNDDVYCEDVYYTYYDIFNPENGYIAPGGTQIVCEDGMDFGTAEETGAITDIKSMSFSFTIEDAQKCTTLVNKQKVSVDIKADHNIDLGPDEYSISYREPACGILAKEQVLVEDKEKKITLLGLGGDGSYSTIEGVLKIENYSTENLCFCVSGVSLDGITIPAVSSNVTVYPQTTVYSDFLVSDDMLEEMGITSAHGIELFIESMDSEWIAGFSEFKRYKIDLEVSGEPAVFKEGNKVLFEENGIRIALLDTGENSTVGRSWIVSVVNESENDYQLDVSNISINGKEYKNSGYYGLGFTSNQIGAGEKTTLEINYYDDVSKVNQLSSGIVFMDITGEEILYTSVSKMELIP